MERVASMQAKRVKKRRPIKDGAGVGLHQWWWEMEIVCNETDFLRWEQNIVSWEEYHDYVFPEDEKAKGGLKILQMAREWKKQKTSAGGKDSRPPPSAE